MLFQSLQDSLPFYFVQRHAGKGRTLGGFYGFVMALILRFKIRGFQSLFSADKNGTFHQIFQFTDITRIRQAGKEVQRVRRKFGMRQTVYGSLTIGKVACQQRNILTAFAQGGQFYGYQIDTVEKVFTECTLGNHFAQIGIGGGDYTYIHFARTAVAQHFKCLVLKYTQQFNLTGQIQITYFIQKDSAFVGQLKTTYTVGARIGKSAFLMTEHLALEQTLRNTAEIDFHERLFGALAVNVDGLGYQLLTCTALTGNEYGSVGTGYAGHGIQHFHQPL